MAVITYDDLTWAQKQEAQLAGISETDAVAHYQKIADEEAAANQPPAQPPAPTTPAPPPNTPEYDRWRLYAGGQTLGEEDNDANLISQFDKEVLPATIGQYSTTRLNTGQADTYRRFDAERQAATGVDEVSAIYGKYGIPFQSMTGAQEESAFSNKTLGQLYGYSGANLGTAKNFYTNKYGTAEGFAEGNELNQAYDRVYGEIQGAPDMGKGWSDLYSTVSEWDAQDDEWLRLAKEAQGLESGAKAQQRAKMSAGGMTSGSKQWETNLQNIDAARVNVEGEREEKRQALKSTSIYQALDAEYKKNYLDPQMRAKGETVTSYRDVIDTAGYTRPSYTDSQQRYNSETGETYFEEVYHPEQWVDPTYKQEAYQDYKETETKTGNLLYGQGEQSAAPTFGEYYKQNFGAQDFSDSVDIYGTEEDAVMTLADENARRAASGHAFS